MKEDQKRPVIAVSGGAGYLGRCTMDVLWNEGYQPICLDNYSNGKRFQSDRVPAHEVELTDRAAVETLWKKLPPIAGILHFAALALVGESNERPGDYFRNNLMATVTLAEIASRDAIPFIHSSSCAVYGIPKKIPITETCPQDPISPYGETKRGSEQILSQFSQTQGLRVLNLRYFNPAGALEALEHGESHSPETHLIPNVLRQGFSGKPVSVFGTDYPTPDGSCVRDFIHVEDLARGHIHALKHVSSQPKGYCDAVNLGSGKGCSVLEVIAGAERVLGKKLEVDRKPRRPGDPPHLVASTEKAQKLLGWSPRKGIDDILRSHLEWEKRRGYAK